MFCWLVAYDTRDLNISAVPNAPLITGHWLPRNASIIQQERMIAIRVFCAYAIKLCTEHVD